MMAPLKQEWLEVEGGNLQRMLGGAGHDHVPINPFIIGHAAPLHGKTVYEYYTEPALGVEMTISAAQFYDAAPMTMWLYAIYWAEDYGAVLKWPEARMSAPAISEYPAETPELAEQIEPLSPEEMTKGPTMTRHWEALEAYKKIMGPAFTPYQFVYEMFVNVAYWVGPENLLMWVHSEPELVKDLMGKVVEHSVTANELVVKEYGGAMIIASSLLANSSTLAPETCREFNIVYLKDMVEKSIKKGAGPVLYHLCGDHGEDYPLHHDVPTPQGSVMHVAYDGQKPADLCKVAEVFEDKCCLLGNTDTIPIHIGTPEQNYETAKRETQAYKNFKNGFIAGLACECPTFAPPANVQAWIRGVKEEGELD